MSPVLNSGFFINRTSPSFFEGKSECRVRVFLKSGFCTGPSPGPSPSPVRVSHYANRKAEYVPYILAFLKHILDLLPTGISILYRVYKWTLILQVQVILQPEHPHICRNFNYNNNFTTQTYSNWKRSLDLTWKMFTFIRAFGFHANKICSVGWNLI